VATNALADPPLSASVVVVITVDDVNEFAPSFIPPTPDRVNVLEYSHPQDMPVLHLFADDDDCVSCITVSLADLCDNHYTIFCNCRLLMMIFVLQICCFNLEY